MQRCLQDVEQHAAELDRVVVLDGIRFTEGRKKLRVVERLVYALGGVDAWVDKLV